MVPERLTVYAGETAKFICKSDDEVSWETFNGGDLPSNAEIMFDKWYNYSVLLRIRNAVTTNTGNYTCASERHMVITSVSAVLTVIGNIIHTCLIHYWWLRYFFKF